VDILPDSMARSNVSASADATTSDSLSGTAEHTECSLLACTRVGDESRKKEQELESDTCSR